MAEYIDREEAKSLLELALEDDWEVRYAEDRLNEIPAADVAPVIHAHWAVEGGRICCSVCGEQSLEYDYCPYCGAKMDEEG